MKKTIFYCFAFLLYFDKVNAMEATDTCYIQIIHDAPFDKPYPMIFLCSGKCSTQVDTLVDDFAYHYISLPQADFDMIINSLKSMDNKNIHKTLKYPIVIRVKGILGLSTITIINYAKAVELFDKILKPCISENSKKMELQSSSVHFLSRSVVLKN